jgi:hypothetical protein
LPGETHVGDQGLHFRRLRRKRPTVHAARHAGIEALLDRNLRASPSAILGKIPIAPEKRQSEFLGSRFEMAIAAGQIVSCGAFGGIFHVRSDMSVGLGDEVAPASHQAAVIVIWKRVNVRDGPGRGVSHGVLVGPGR